MKSTLKSIGPAVFNGGISTMIGISMLITSESHVFISYFKVNSQAPQLFLKECICSGALLTCLLYRYFSLWSSLDFIMVLLCCLSCYPWLDLIHLLPKLKRKMKKMRQKSLVKSKWNWLMISIVHHRCEFLCIFFWQIYFSKHMYTYVRTLHFSIVPNYVRAHLCFFKKSYAFFSGKFPTNSHPTLNFSIFWHRNSQNPNYKKYSIRKFTIWLMHFEIEITKNKNPFMSF